MAMLVQKLIQFPERQGRRQRIPGTNLPKQIEIVADEYREVPRKRPFINTHKGTLRPWARAIGRWMEDRRNPLRAKTTS